MKGVICNTPIISIIISECFAWHDIKYFPVVQMWNDYSRDNKLMSRIQCLSRISHWEWSPLQCCSNASTRMIQSRGLLDCDDSSIWWNANIVCLMKRTRSKKLFFKKINKLLFIIKLINYKISFYDFDERKYANSMQVTCTGTCTIQILDSKLKSSERYLQDFLRGFWIKVIDISTSNLDMTL